MHVHAYERTMAENGVLTLENLPFHAGEKLEVIIIPRSQYTKDAERYPYWGKPITYLNPTEPVTEADWESLK